MIFDFRFSNYYLTDYNIITFITFFLSGKHIYLIAEILQVTYILYNIYIKEKSFLSKIVSSISNHYIE